MSDTASVIIKAANFAAIKHKDQRRKDPDQTPYINHPIGVAHILTNVSIHHSSDFQNAGCHISNPLVYSNLITRQPGRLTVHFLHLLVKTSYMISALPCLVIRFE